MPAAGGDSLTNGSLFIFTDPAVSGCDEGPASLLGNAFQRLQANDLAAGDAFSAALGRGQEELGGPTPLEACGSASCWGLPGCAVSASRRP